MTSPQASPRQDGGRRGDLLAALRAAPAPASILDLATRLDLHPNTVRFHLEALVEAGRAERVEIARTGPGRPPQMFRAREGMDPSGPRNYRLLADILTARLAAEPDATAQGLAAGQARGRRLPLPQSGQAPLTAPEAVEDLVRALDDFGFAPEAEQAAGSMRIFLRHCPFLDMAGTRSSVVCPIHLGLMRGVLETRNAGIAIDRLEPFAEPDLCLAHLAASSNPTRDISTGSDT